MRSLPRGTLLRAPARQPIDAARRQFGALAETGSRSNRERIGPLVENKRRGSRDSGTRPRRSRRSPGSCWRHRHYPFRRDPILTTAALVQAALLLVAIVGTIVDPRTSLGLNVWIKPAKFALSVAIYLGTLAWLQGYLTLPSRLRSAISWSVAVVMFLENALIFYQAARGARSHFNFETAIDGSIFAIMGLLIAANTLLFAGFSALFFTRRATGQPVLLASIRAGLVLFLVGSAIGGLMVALGSHTVGAADGGPGLPMLNWSLEAGDIRIPHLFALHSLQVLPFAGWWLANRRPLFARPGLAVATLTVAWSTLIVVTLVLALLGRPLIPL